ncbi:MAG: VOC family protein [Xenococcaceae cyanobacterium]
MITQSLSKTILYVKNMDAQINFYRNILELQIKYPVGLKSYSNEIWVEFATGECTLALHLDSNKQLGQDRPKLVFSVKDIETARQQLLDRGVNIGDINSRFNGVKVADGFDPEGNPFSIYGEAIA